VIGGSVQLLVRKRFVLATPAVREDFPVDMDKIRHGIDKHV